MWAAHISIHGVLCTLSTFFLDGGAAYLVQIELIGEARKSQAVPSVMECWDFSYCPSSCEEQTCRRETVIGV